MGDARVSRYNDEFRKVLQYLKQVLPSVKEDSWIGSVIANTVEKMEEKGVFEYSLKRG